MLTDLRTTLILGLICLPVTAASAHAAPAPRQKPPRMSGPTDRPVPGDSRFPGRQPRPNGALLAPLGHASLRLTAERLCIRCRFGGGGCAVRHEYMIRNTGDATTVDLAFVSPRMAVLAEVNGKRAVVGAGPVPNTMIQMRSTYLPGRSPSSRFLMRQVEGWAVGGRSTDREA